MLKLVLVAAGGALGSVLRYLLSWWIQGSAVFPWGILVVNVSGCLAIGILATVFAGPGLNRDEYRAAVLIGVLGGYTTFSSFGWDTFRLATGGQLGLAVTYVLLTNILGLGAVWVGNRLAVTWFGVA